MVPQRFKDDGHRVDINDYDAAVLRAKQLCDVCAVQAPCRTYGLAISRQVEDHGVYGGLSMEEREQLIGHSMKYDPPRQAQTKCGTAGGHRRHQLRKERPCDVCRAYKAERTRERRHRLRTQAAETRGGHRGKSVEEKR